MGYSYSSINGWNYYYCHDLGIIPPGSQTAAEYNHTSNTVTLLGYNSDSNFVIELTNFNDSNFSQGLVNKFQLVIPENSSIQTEGLTSLNNYYYISAEEYLGNSQVLYKINKDSLLSN